MEYRKKKGGGKDRGMEAKMNKDKKSTIYSSGYTLSNKQDEEENFPATLAKGIKVMDEIDVFEI